MKVSVTDILRMYPKRRGTCAVSGRIPMSVFNVFEKELRPEMRAKGYRVQYRGPRRFKDATNTRRADATHAVIYFRN